jgi:hypothetical protein
MRTPDFFAAVPAITVIDPLAELLGAAQEGRLQYRYLDAVKLAGHSCPTVAGAWLLSAKALGLLYPESLPRRGEIKVELRQALDGVLASVAGLITGAANASGFKGLGGRFGRQGLLQMGVTMRGSARFTRLDSGQSVELLLRPQQVPQPAGLARLMQAALLPQADAPTRQAFGAAWQDWVRRLLLEHAEDPDLLQLIEPPAAPA